MANNFDKGMDDCYCGKELPKDPTIEYLQGYGYAESLLYPQKNPLSEQMDDRIWQEESEEK